VNPRQWCRSRLTGILSFVVVAAGVGGGVLSLAPSADASSAPAKVVAHATTATGACPWVGESLRHAKSSVALAGEVLAKMTLSEKASFVVLATYPPLENRNTAIPSLCIPALSLTDGPNGVANGMTGVTQFPASIAIAASFNASLARSIGQAVATEARTKGISGVQGPEVNLARVPQSGRIFETYGEDPYLAGLLGVASIEGIQSTGDLADAKHFSAYTQETARLRLNQVVSVRALAELYDAPFKAMVQQAHVASVMCSYGELNGVNTCSDPYVYSTLHSWGFTGFVRSDLGAVPNMANAFKAGISLIKPGSSTVLVHLVQSGVLPIGYLNAAVRAVLTPMFAHGLIARPLHGSLYANATTAAHANLALRAAENSVVLLKNAHSILPLSKNVTSIAVIGVAAGLTPQVAGGGSSKVQPPYVVTPISAIRKAVGGTVHVSYAPGGPPTLDLDQLSDVDIVGGKPLKLVKPIKYTGEPGKADIALQTDPGVTRAALTATKPGSGAGWDKWSFVVRARKTGTYEISFQQFGDTWLYLNHNQLLASLGLHAPSDISATVQFVAGHRYTFSARWFQIRNHPAPMFSLTDVTPLINAAVASARHAKVAIVFVGDFNTEGADRPNMSLPGDGNALISAVAAVNPHTIVVLNTGGAVLMPWLSKVAGVLEAWYPGQEDGAAIAAILHGGVDPSGRLPLTFPASDTAMPATSAQQFPGVNLTVNFGTGLDVGYRWYQINHVTPLFAFGFGLSYTTFTLSKPTLTKTTTGAIVRVKVTNTGTRAGADVVQAYVSYPTSAGEPPEQLRALVRVDLGPNVSKTVTMTVPKTGFQIYRSGAFTTVSGRYGIDVGQSSSDLPLHLSLHW
jgi:beta-glucosidase